MSLPSTTLNVALLGVYGRTLYTLHQKQLERLNTPRANRVENKLPLEKELEKEIKNELNPLLCNRQLVLENTSISVELPNKKVVVVSPAFYKKDKEACKFLVKWNLQYDLLLANRLYTLCLVGTIGQVALSVISLCSRDEPFPGTLLSAVVFNVLVYPSIVGALHPLPDFFAKASSDEDLIVGRRLFTAMKKLKNHSIPVGDIQKCIREFDLYIEERKITINSEEEDKKINSLEEYFLSTQTTLI